MTASASRDQRPRQLTRMPQFANDRLKPSLTHGDLLLQVCAADEASCIHALRYLMLGTRDSLVVRWLINGFQQRPGGDRGRSAASHPAQPARLQGRDGEPARHRCPADGRARLGRSEPGRAGLGGRRHLYGRSDDPDVRGALGPDGARRAGGHHRADEADRRAARARRGKTTTRGTPRTRTVAPSRLTPTSGSPTRGPPRRQPNRILRRGYSYSRGFDDAGLLDQGLMFVAFQQDLERGFVTVQRRLDGRAARGVHPAGRRRLLLRAARGQRPQRHHRRHALRLSDRSRPAGASVTPGREPPIASDRPR